MAKFKMVYNNLFIKNLNNSQYQENKFTQKTLMKALMNLAKQKRQQDTSYHQPSSLAQKSQLNKFAQQPPSQMSEQPQDFDGDYEPQLEEIIAYAEFIGIKLPQEEDLLWIAQQGLKAELPPDWEQAETQQGEVAYTNVRTGQIMFEHPCDEYYRQLVLKQRKKTPSKLPTKSSNLSAGGFQPIGSMATKSQPLRQKQPQPIVDPLVKMQRQKQLKKLEQQKKKQYTQKKQTLKQKFQSKKQQLQREYRTKQQKSKNRFSQQLQKQRKLNIQKMSQQQKQQQRRRQDEIRQYQKQVKQKQQRLLQQRMKRQRQILQKKYQKKREEIRIQLQRKLKQQKKQIDELYQEKYRQLENKQKQIEQESVELMTNRVLQEEITGMKQDIIRKKLVKYAEKLKQQTDHQKVIYTQQLQRLQTTHNTRINQLQQHSTSSQFTQQSNQKLQQLIKQIQSYQKQQLKIFQYELDVMKQMKRFEMEQKIEQYKVKLVGLQKERLNEIIKQMEREFESYKQLKEHDYERILVETEKKAKQDFMHGLKVLQRKFAQQQQIAMLQTRKSPASLSIRANMLQKQNLQSLNRTYQQLQFRQRELRKQRENIKLQIQNLRSQSHIANPMIKMNQQQIKLYQLIQQKIRNNCKGK